MNQIASHIERLLATNTCVTVPGLGAFRVVSVPAQFTDGKVTPPHGVVVFDGHPEEGNGLLALSLVRSEHMSYAAAQTQIASAVTELRQLLAGGKPVALGRLGYLSQTSSDELLFTARTADYLPQNYGLAPLYVTPRQASSRVVELPTAGRWVRYAASVLLIVGLWGASNVQNYDRVTEAALYTLPVRLAEPEPVVTPYHLVMATLATGDAQAYCELLWSEGYPDVHLLEGRKGTSYVVLSDYSTRSDAVQALRTLRVANTRFAHLWIYEEKE